MIARRKVLEVVLQSTALACLGSSGLACAYGKSAASGPVQAGNIRAVPVGHFAFVAGAPVLLARDERGLYALSAICTHWGCNMASDGKVTAEGMKCECHGSRFDKAGKVLEGPASDPLVHYKVDLAPNGEIVVDAGTKVAEDVRTPVPAG
jgi:Rieske Fe-S protein